MKRIRVALAQTPMNSGLRDYGTAEGFAKLIDRSVSSVRNVESGSTKKWDRLARQIEKKTGVSADWMLGNPDPDSPILKADGSIWNPEEALDPLFGGRSGWNWQLLLEANPESVVRLVTKMVETRLSLELLRRNGPETPVTSGGIDFLRQLVGLIEESECFRDQRFVCEISELAEKETPRIMERVFRSRA